MRQLNAPSLLFSLALHAAVLVILGICYLPIAVDFQPDLTADVAILEELDDFRLLEEEPLEAHLDEPVLLHSKMALSDDSPVALFDAPFETDLNAVAETPVEFSNIDLAEAMSTESIFPSLDSLSARDFSARSNRGAAAAGGGGTEASERAVALGLSWLVAHQLPNGAWSYTQLLNPNCRGQCQDSPVGRANGGLISATAFALLPMLGCGMTHKEGRYKEQVKAGLDYITSRCRVQQGVVILCEPGANPEMYHHGLTAILLAELAAMTRDKDLETLAQGAVNYIVWAQDPVGGGWRYTPRQPGDTSGLGWNFMALKSAQMGGLSVPPMTIRGTKHFLDHVTAVDGGAYYGYLDNSFDDNTSPALTAIGLLCQMYMGWQADNPALDKGTDFLAKLGPKTDNLYYSYYATQVMHHVGGEKWEKWNSQMRDALVASQIQTGHERGSWPVEKGITSESGGRLMSTALATMILEVYYRHMPLYRKNTTLEDFPLE